MSDSIDSAFYFEPLVVKVDGTLMKIPRALFARSPVFQDMFTLPQGSKAAEGGDDTHPLVLEDVSGGVFKLFVRVAHASELMNSPLPLITCVELADVYDLAARWQMSHMCEVITNSVIASFNDDYVVRKLYLANRLGRNDWIASAVDRIIRRSRTLDSEEVVLLSPQTAASLLDLRERYRMAVVGSYLTPKWSADKFETSTIMQASWGLAEEVQGLSASLKTRPS